MVKLTTPGVLSKAVESALSASEVSGLWEVCKIIDRARCALTLNIDLPVSSCER